MIEPDRAIEKAWAELEHRLGVLPLLGAFFPPGEELDAVVEGRRLGALGLFTPTPEGGLGTLAGEPCGDGLLVRGVLRLPGESADGSIVLVRSGTEHRLAWLDHGAPGVVRRGARTGGPVAHRGPRWLHVEGTVIDRRFVSRPVTLEPDGLFVGFLATYATAWAAAAASCALEGVRALRRAARTSGFQASQLVALGITAVEIEADLAAAAARQTGGLAVAAAASRALCAVAAKTGELHHACGLEIDGPLGVEDGCAATLTSYLGGPAVLDGLVARTLDL